jgi:hypothetical protein
VVATSQLVGRVPSKAPLLGILLFFKRVAFEQARTLADRYDDPYTLIPLPISVVMSLL